MSTISVHLPGMIKLWLLWPPSPFNMSLFRASYATVGEERSCFELVAMYLEKGQVALADGRHALFIPAGWIHFVYTLCRDVTEYTYEDLVTPRSS